MGKKSGAPADNEKSGGKNMPLTTANYKLMLVGFVVIIIGFVLMSGGGSDDPVNYFNYDMFSFRRITLVPIVVLAGFVFEIYAILKRPKDRNETGQ